MTALGEAARARAERYFVPNDIQADGSLDVQVSRARNLRMVGVIAGGSVVAFAPSMVVAGVPVERWPAYLAGVLVAAVVISVSLLAVGPGSRYALVAAAANAIAIAGLGLLIGDYYHQLVLLFALVVAGHAVIHGLRAAMVMIVLGSFLVPVALTDARGINPTDPLYASIYLSGLAAIIWIRKRLMRRSLDAIQSSEARYRALLETMPAVVYIAEFGASGAWRYVSPQVEALLGYPAEDWIADPDHWWSRILPEDRSLALSQEDKASRIPEGQRVVVEYRMVARDGGVRWIRDEAAVIRSPSGEADAWSGFLIDVTDRRSLEDQLKHQAFHDPLTGLANRVLFGDRVAHALARRKRGARTLAVLFLDLDDFKTINDGLGHSAGDALLRDVAERINRCLRPGDTAARLGGDEFAVLLEDLVDVDGAVAVARRVLDAMARPVRVEGQEILASASIGIAYTTSRRERPEELLRNADVAMYSAKGRGKGRFEIYEQDMHAALLRRLEIVAEIRNGLAAEEFSVHYQPVVRLSDGAITGFEALARWNHPRLGLVLPADFIPVAEETGQILELGAFVLKAACRQARAWRDAEIGGPAPSMSVNVSARQFRSDSLSETVAQALAIAGLPAQSLILEITESVVMDDSEASLERLRDLKALGVKLAIDDFGTGYSSLSYLRRLPVDILKIDKSFIDEIRDGSDAPELTRVIVEMGNTLHLDVVAEGVETRAQASALRRIGCSLAQGYHFGRPMVADDIARIPAIDSMGGLSFRAAS